MNIKLPLMKESYETGSGVSGSEQALILMEVCVWNIPDKLFCNSLFH